MLDQTIAPTAATKTQETDSTLRRFINWVWKLTDDSKTMNTKPFDGIL